MKKCALAVFAIWCIWFVFCVRGPLFPECNSLVVYDREGNLIGARIAEDEQWRFPEIEVVPDRYEKALLCFEDRRFFNHPGVDPVAICRAMISNLKAGKVVSGGSTLTMQLARLSEKSKSRSIWRKTVEATKALRIETKYSKDEILRKYASHAPFGGNVVGLEAASWRYFAKSPDLLTWSEAATLAVLPNSPALIHPGRNRDALKEKRNRLLERMLSQDIIDSMDFHLSLLEPIPPQPFPLPQIASHFVDFVGRHGAQRFQTTIDPGLQDLTKRVVDFHHQLLAQNEVQNAAALILDTKTGEVLAYLGNVGDRENRFENQVDMIHAERSSGSILKPFLYASAMQEGMLLPNMLLPDVPSVINGYRPENYHRGYDGKVGASEALSRSLNVPAVLLLKEYGVERFRRTLQDIGLTSIHYSADHYGLPLILGGAETTLWDITSAYATMGRVLQNAFPLNHEYDPADIHVPEWNIEIDTAEQQQKLVRHAPLWEYGALWSVMEAMQEVSRPEGQEWQLYDSGQPISWKTGTSYGYRDAWAVGISTDYTVGVWVGNADGEGRPGIVGVKAAAPILFDIFRSLPVQTRFEPPYDVLKEEPICRLSGHQASSHCTEIDSVWIPQVGLKTELCPYHNTVLLDQSMTYQVNNSCLQDEDALSKSFFILDPVAEYYYRLRHPEYQNLPEFHPDCQQYARFATLSNLDLIYPGSQSKVFIPTELDGSEGKLICKATHRHEVSLFWYLDNQFLGKTTDFHSMAIHPENGEHLLIVVDEFGERRECTFEVLD